MSPIIIYSLIVVKPPKWYVTVSSFCAAACQLSNLNDHVLCSVRSNVIRTVFHPGPCYFYIFLVLVLQGIWIRVKTSPIPDAEGKTTIQLFTQSTYIHKSRIARPWCMCMFIFVGATKLSQSEYTNLHFHQDWMRLLLLYIFANSGIIRLLNFATWMDIQYYFPIVWIFTYHYLSVMKLSSFSYVDNAVFSQCGMSVHIFCPFLYMIICLLLIDFQSYLHFSNTDPLSVCNLYFSCFIMFI